jgi:site-specific DNA-methyltransferase (adenine-specific)
MTDLQNTTTPPIAYSECYVLPFFSFYNADNMAIMKTFKDKEFDLAIVDPPYGIYAGKMTMGSGKHKFTKGKEWDSGIPTAEYFEQLFRVSKNQIIWGGNYFTEHLKSSPHWLIWDKKNPNLSFAEGEMAWVHKGKNLRIFCKYSALVENGGKIHPTQKPVDLYDWILTKYAKDGFKILDTHLGSGSIAIAIDKANTLDKKNLTFVGIELDPDYFKAAIERFKNYKLQQTLF